jgi:type I restriction enzyme, R subunit
VDVQTCKNVVIARVINSMTEFKQIIGRGTRVRDDYGKLFFNILDYTGSATRLFADPEFDGEPALITEEEMNEIGETVKEVETVTEEQGIIIEEEGPIWEPPGEEGPEVERRKYYVDSGFVEIAAHLVYELDPDGKQLRVVKFTDYTAEKVRSMYASAAALRSKWSDAEERSSIIEALDERGISFSELAEAAKQPDADPFDLLCHVAFNAPLRTRRERAEMLRKEKKNFFDEYSPDARAVLNEMLEKYIEFGTAQFQIPDILKVPPISDRGTIPQIAKLFGGAEKLRSAVIKLQSLLYAA